MASDFVLINDVGPRDGLQNQSVMVPTEGKLRLIKSLVNAGLQSIEATAFVSPKAVPQMADAKDVIAQLPEKDKVAYSALIPNEKGYERAREAGVESVALVLSATDTMNQKNIRMSLNQTREVCRTVAARAAAEQVTCRAYVAVAFECPYEGAVNSDVVLSLTDEMFEAGATEVIIADTIGAASPSAVYHMVEALKVRFDLENISAHFHDTRAMGIANAWAAVQAGLRKLDGSIAGLGGCPFAPGASGNVATEDLVLMLHQCGYQTGVDVDKLLFAVAVAEQLIGRELGGRMLPWVQSKRAREANKAASA